MTYASSGVSYDSMDPFKVWAQEAGRETAPNLKDHGFSEFEPSRGESAYLIETPWGFLAHVEEGLGTKNLVTALVFELTGQSYYAAAAQDTVAMIVNDLITVGAMPLSVAMHLAVFASQWFHNQERSKDLILGWKEACNLAGCAWGGGETPVLRDLICLKAEILSGSAIGLVTKENLIRSDNIRAGDAIVLIGSLGIHANGLTLARQIGEKLSDGFLTKIPTDPQGRSYAEVLLDPTIIYVPLIRDCQKEGIRIHYAVNITGHGWRKLMRPTQPFAYVIDRVAEPEPPIFRFIQEHGPVDDAEAYGNLNMGAGFAIYLAPTDVRKVIALATGLGFKAWHAGQIEPAKEKRLVIRPKNLEYLGSTLQIR